MYIWYNKVYSEITSLEIVGEKVKIQLGIK